jgi:hypothetical protein
MELSRSWGSASYAATQELPSILWNRKVYCRVHKSPPLVPILSHISLVHTTPSYLSKIHFNIIHPPTSWYKQYCGICIAYIDHSIAFLLFGSVILWETWPHLRDMHIVRLDMFVNLTLNPQPWGLGTFFLWWPYQELTPPTAQVSRWSGHGDFTTMDRGTSALSRPCVEFLGCFFTRLCCYSI